MGEKLVGTSAWTSVGRVGSFDGDAITGEATLTLAESCTEASTEAGWATTYEVVEFELGAQYDGS